jgi:hypothetical protein
LGSTRLAIADFFAGDFIVPNHGTRHTEKPTRALQACFRAALGSFQEGSPPRDSARG